jgi:thiol-disulfide isomerase/thioredoxin
MNASPFRRCQSIAWLTRDASSLLVAIACVVFSSQVIGQPVAAPPTPTVDATKQPPAPIRDGESRLLLSNGDYVTGELSLGESIDRFYWRSKHFAEDLAFPMDSVGTMTWRRAFSEPEAGGFAFRLCNGDYFVGDIVAWTDELVTIRVPSLGEIQFESSRLAEVRRRDPSNRILFQSPGPAEAWTNLDPNRPWLVEGGTVVSSTSLSKVRGEIGLPDKCRIELTLAWKRVPNFVIRLACENSGEKRRDLAQLQAYQKKIVLLRRTSQNAQLIKVADIGEEMQRLDCVLLINQTAGTIACYSSAGIPLGEANVPAVDGEIRSAIQLADYVGDLAVERLIVTSWSGELPTFKEGSNASISTVDGQAIDGQIKAFDASTQSLKIQQGEQAAIDLPLSNINGCNFTILRLDSENHFRAVQLVDQTRLHGDWLGGKDGRIQFQSSAMRSPTSFSVSDVASLGRCNQVKGTLSSDDQARAGTLVLGDTRLQGWLEPATAEADRSCFRWRPSMAAQSAVLRDAAEGEIVYRLSQPPRDEPVERPTSVIANPFKLLTMGGADNASSIGSAFLSLDTGDRFEAYVTKIDDTHVHFHSNATETKSIPIDRVIEVGLTSRNATATYAQTPVEQQRLLTVPRMQKNNPPTHLLVSPNNDHLRGRLIKMDEELVEVEVRLQTIQIPRTQISSILWLRKRGWDAEEDATQSGADPSNPEATNAADERFRVQVISADGLQVSFEPQAVAEGQILGPNQLLGAMKSSIDTIDRMSFGKKLSKRMVAKQLTGYELSLAPTPKVLDEAEAIGADAGKLSPLVGKAAYQFELQDMSDQKFRLSSLKDRIIVLDFWASWCGPCRQSMPAIEQAVAELGKGQVDLLAINLEETPDRAQTAIDQLRLKAKVLLDEDGAVAGHYQAESIPQTVIIDRDMNVAFVFVGADEATLTAIREAIESLVSKP